MALNFRSIKAKTWLFTAVFGILLIAQFSSRYAAEKELADDLKHIAHTEIRTLELTYMVRIATTQVQQWLTDIRATRGQDGLNDGFDEARDQYRLFRDAISELANLHPERSKEYSGLLPDFEDYYDVGTRMAEAYIQQGPAGGNPMMARFDEAAERINKRIDALLAAEKKSMNDSLLYEVTKAEDSLGALIFFCLVYFVLLLILAVGNQAVLVRPMARLAEAIALMGQQLKANGQVDFDTSALNTDKQSEIGLIGSNLLGLVDGLKAQSLSAAELARETLRVKLALDVTNTNVMMADNDLNIIYMNSSVTETMIAAEPDLKQDLPNFNARELMGQNIDVFHKNPAHQRGMLAKLQDVYNTRIKVGGRTFGLIATPIFAEDKERLGTVVEWDDMTERLALEQTQLETAADNARIKTALDKVTANVMMADADRNIIYTNDAVIATLRSAQEDIRTELPNFNVDNLLGHSIDQFHKNPNHQMQMLDRLTNTMSSDIVVGGRYMNLIVSPVSDAEGNRLGSVVEWTDRTAEVQTQKEMDKIIAASNDGDLSERIPLEGKEGFFRSMSEGLNSLLDKTAMFVEDMSAMFEAMSDGDLTRTVNNEYRGEFEVIANNANNTVLKLTEVMGRIQGASGTLRTSANEVAQGSDDLSRRTESQASSLEETAASMEEITATVKQTSENASQANTLASEAKLTAQTGGTVVNDAVNAMSEILDSSNKINDIIGVIDEIAFQTNLLALNAAVEAARAGEQGRGFAVVAGEVRTLSQRSAAAAKEIKDLIRDSVNKVESGSTLVNQSGKNLAEIVTAVDKVAVMIQDVNNAAIEQNSGISQINQAITQMDEMTQQNAALVEETSAASRSMSEEATSMNNLISFFKLNGQAAAASTVNPSMSAPASEPIQTYSPAPASPGPQSGADGVASFSESDDWEDF